ncbi:MAG: hypothetical protein ACSHXA_07505 [Polaribacter sp.]|uniref:hypothetical protein n=1 Tax=Polaribacter sp. TaxID=1920175 RepID=UPI003EF92D6B
MANYRKSVAAPKIGAGAAKPKKGNITVIFADDVLSFPERDANGVRMLGNIIVKADATMHTLHMVPSSQKMTDEIVGDEGFEAFDKKTEGIHAGNSLDIREFRKNTLGVGVILIYGAGCGANQGDVFGSPCNPMYLKGSYSSDTDGVKNTMMYEALIKDSEAIGYYEGEITLAENFVAATVALDLTETNGPVQQLPSLAATDEITATSIDLANGTIVSLIGGGGADPATLDIGVQGAVTVILINDTQWVALDKAVINLEVISGGATTYLVERSRA